MKALYAPGLLLFCLALFFFPAALAKGLRSGFDLLTSVALPALFPYMVITAIIRKSGCITPLSRLFAPLFSRLFGVGKNGVLPILTALLAGYPIGISVICSLADENKLSRKEAERLLFFCANPSPAFLIAGVGAGLYQNCLYGIFLYAVLTSTALLAGFVQNLFLPSAKPSSNESSLRPSPPPLFSVLVSSVRESVVSMAYVGGFLLFFAALSRLLSPLPLAAGVKMLIMGFLEVTSGIFSFAASLESLPLIAFLCGFGGLCVAAQSAVFIEKAGLSLSRYFFGRLFVAVFSAVFCVVFLKISTQIA